MVDGSRGSAFDDADVARSYAYRPDYPDEMYTFLAGLVPEHNRALDLGCGTGKIAHGLARFFQQIDAVDPSLPMLHVADDGRHPNINWINAPAETAQLIPPYDLVTAGASMHWMDHAAVFARLAEILTDGSMIAVIEGDDVDDAEWSAERLAFLKRWVEKLGGTFDDRKHRASMASYEQWLTILGRQSFTRTVSQPIDYFIECQHSRATWSRANLGPLVNEFDADLRQTLEPFATNDSITYTTSTRVVWGVPVEPLAIRLCPPTGWIPQSAGQCRGPAPIPGAG